MKIVIKNDLFDIVDRLKEIDPRYVVMFDDDLSRYELTIDDKFAAVIPYENLDERTLRFAYYTRSENAETVLADIDKHNEELRREEIKKMQDKVEDDFSRATRLLKI